VTFVATAGLVPMAAWASRRLGAVARPRSDRWGVREVPTLGGIALTAGLVAGLAVLGATGSAAPGDVWPLILGTLAMAALGLVDDLGTIGPLSRLGVQVAVGVAFTAVVTTTLPVELRVVALAIAIVAVPGVINATNLVDNVDGLSSTLSAVTALTLAGLAVASGAGGPATVVGPVIAAGCLAFLLWNRPPASIFMGDVGSLALGFLLAGTTILLVRQAVESSASGPIVIVLVPLAWAGQLGDLVMVSLTRLRRGVSPLRGGVDHTSHRLLMIGAGPWSVLLVIGLGAAALGAVAVWAAGTREPAIVVASAAIGLAAIASFEAWLVRRTTALLPVSMGGRA
jgi:UDP-GlcNAc:undecaprenyl-phosphate GlcNAc-1-phosphate transferase